MIAFLHEDNALSILGNLIGLLHCRDMSMNDPWKDLGN